MSEELKEKPIEIPKSLAFLLGGESAQVTFDNMTKLCNQKEYTINDVVFKRKMLKPKELVEFMNIQKTLDETKDPETRMQLLKEQAKLCLTLKDNTKDFDAVWEDTDAVHMEIVLGACMLIARGFRKI